MPQNSGKDYKARQVDVSQPLMAGGPVGGNQGGDYIQQPVAYAPEIARCVATREGSSQDYETTTMVVGVTGDIAHTLKAEGADASEDGTGRGTPIVSYARTVALRGREGGATAELGGEVATALRASSGGGDKPHVLTSAVRRLTPTECERLQGFPDDYTAIPWRGKPASECPDGPRYKALGNSWAVPKFVWLGRRLAAHMPVAAPIQKAA
jgi:DNA (cytosine-5)-methyltransferase 1